MQTKYYCLLFFTLIFVACGSTEEVLLDSSSSVKKVTPTSTASLNATVNPSPTPILQTTSTPSLVPAITPTPSPIPAVPKPTPTPAPETFSIFTDFNKSVNNVFFAYVQGYQGSANFNIFDPNALDNKIVRLTYFGKETEAGPGYSTQLESYDPNYFYGTYQARFKTATCANANEGVISAFFLYFNDGKDYNKNGWADNIEIDIEILCAEPQTIYMSIWTDYQDDTHFIKNTRKINLATGKYSQTKAGQEKQWGLNSSGSLPFVLPTIFPSTQYVELGFEWLENSVRFYLIDQGKEYELWNYQNIHFIPHYPAYQMFNLWHNASHWHNDQPAQSPSQPVKMAIDYFAHEPSAN